MNYYKNLIREYYAPFIIAIVALSIVAFVFYLAIIGKDVKIEKVYISEQKDKCEKLGGRYGLTWVNITSKYYETCEIPYKVIKM